MLSGVLQEMLSIFDCDRAWLLYPCDPAAPSWHVPMEHTRPEWPGALAMNLDIPMDSETAAVFEYALNAKTAVRYDADSFDIPAALEPFSIRSQLLAAIHPKVDMPWLLGIHHCTNERVYTDEEAQLLSDISWRIGESLNSLLIMRQLRANERYNRMLFEQSPIGLATRRIDGSLVDINDMFSNILGWDMKEIQQLSYSHIIPNSYLEKERQQLKKLRKSKDCTPYELEYLHKNGYHIPISCTARLVDKDGEPHILTSIEDLSERKRAEAKLRKLSKAVEQSADGILITDHTGTIEYVNPTFENMTGYQRHEMVGKKPSILKSGVQPVAFYQNLWDTLLGGKVFEATVINRHKNGELYHQKETITPITDGPSGSISNFVCNCRNVTTEVEAQERLEHLAYHDQLTGLPNRVLFRDRTEQAIRKVGREDMLVPVLFIDLDRFKDINDTLGHEIGDQLLEQVAKRLQSVIREGDTVARFGGDEFTILLEGIASADGISKRAATIVEALDRSFEIGKYSLYVTASIGVAVYPTDAREINALFRSADTAMYQSKNAGGNTYRFFTPEMANTVMQRVTMERSLREALQRGEYVLHYQPRVQVSGGNKTISLEALLRWQPDTSELVAPSSFIPILEETALIVSVGEWALRQACQQLSLLRQKGFNLRMSVNVSPRQFWDGSLPDLLVHCLDEYNIDPDWLELEITESLVMEKSEQIINTLEHIERLGVTIAIDDFGTGFSSLSYLKQLPIHALKIDRSFVEGVNDDPNDAAIAKAIIALGQALHLDVTAEGVETTQQLDFLAQAGCHEAQGFLFAKPMSAETLMGWLAQSK